MLRVYKSGLSKLWISLQTYTAQVTFVFPTSIYADPLACVTSPVFKTVVIYVLVLQVEILLKNIYK